MKNITYYGHSTFMVEFHGVKLLFDPFISGNPLAEGKVDISTIHPDYILVTHGHQDHILDVEAIARQSGATIIANFEVANYFENKDLNVIPMNHGGLLTLDNDVNVKMVNAVHTSSFPDGAYAGQPSGFVVHKDGNGFYYSGDTALTYDMKLIGECPYTKIDYAFLCVGGHFTMELYDAARAAQFVGTEKVIAMHFDTFDPIKIDHDQAIKDFKADGIDLIIPEIGKIVVV